MQIFAGLLVVTFGVLGLAYWGLGQWRVRKRVGSISQSYQKSAPRQFGQQWLTKAAALVAADEDEVKRKLRQSGFYDTRYAHLLMPVKYLLLLLGELSLLVCFVAFNWQSGSWLVLSCVWLMCVVVAPDVYLASRKQALVSKLSSKMPYLLDLMAVCVQTGMTIEASIKYLCQEMKGFDKDLAYMLNRTNDRSRLIGLEKALEELQQQVPSNEIRSFVMTLNQSLHYGSSVYQVLTTLAADIREVQMLSLEEKIGKLAAKMSIPLIIFIMIPIVILIAAPGVMRVFLHV